ncbi:unnamed protein product [Cyclocybe aegerita]|uniref:Uncharacterized protein n=1 Tax=Cyclocybe aegerita TaxID=1973307 RepID=A0A8S0X889_CYCAE|nr:unnamed protein product [Cyclocybe aegerita]
MSSNESTPSPTMASTSLTETIPMRVPQTVPSESVQNVEEEAVKASIPEASSGRNDGSVNKVKEEVTDEDEDESESESESESDDEPPVWKGGMARGRIIRPTRESVGAKPGATVKGGNGDGTNKPPKGS